MDQSFEQALIGAKVLVNIGMGAKHVGRKFSDTEVFEFSRDRGGWSIVPLPVFSKGNPVTIKVGGYTPSREEMLGNQRAYQNRKYSVLSFNCDHGAEILAGNPPNSPQRDGAIIGAATGWAIAKNLPVGLLGTLCFVAAGAIAGIAVVNALDDDSHYAT